MESTFVEEPTPEEEVEILRGMLWEANLSKRLQEESFGTTELRAIQDIIRTIGYPDGTAALSEHVRPVVGAHPDAVLGRVRVRIPENDLPRRTAAFRQERAILQSELANLIARVKSLTPPAPKKIPAGFQSNSPAPAPAPAPAPPGNATTFGGGSGGGAGDSSDEGTAPAETPSSEPDSAPAPSGPAFPRFRHLPVDFRMIIWLYALRAECRSRAVLVDVFSRRIMVTPDLAPRVASACRESRALARDEFYLIQLPVFRISARPRADPERLRARFRRAVTRDAEEYERLRFDGRMREEGPPADAQAQDQDQGQGPESSQTQAAAKPSRPCGVVMLSASWDTFVWGPRLKRTKSQLEMERKYGKKKAVYGSEAGADTGTGTSSSSSSSSSTDGAGEGGDEEAKDASYIQYATEVIEEGKAVEAFLSLAPLENIFGITNIARSTRHPDLALARSLVTSFISRSLSSTTTTTPASGDAGPSSSASASATPRAAAAGLDRSPVAHLLFGGQIAATQFTTRSMQYGTRSGQEARELLAARRIFGDVRARSCFRLDLGKALGTSNAEVLRVMLGGDGRGSGDHNGDGQNQSQGWSGNRAALVGPNQDRRRQQDQPECIARLGRFCTAPGAGAVGHDWALQSPVDGRLVRVGQYFGPPARGWEI